MFKYIMAGALILSSTVLPASAEEMGPGIGRISRSEVYNAHICTKDSDGFLRLRGGPGKSYRPIGKLYPGTSVSVLGRDSGGDGFVWFNVSSNDNRGWVRSDYVCQGID